MAVSVLSKWRNLQNPPPRHQVWVLRSAVTAAGGTAPAPRRPAPRRLARAPRRPDHHLLMPPPLTYIYTCIYIWGEKYIMYIYIMYIYK